MMKKYTIKSIALLVTLFFGCLTASVSKAGAQTLSPPQKSYKFINGQWFDGKTFRPTTFYSSKGILTRKNRAKVDAVIDLKNGFVIPPLAEAHNHWLEPKQIDEYIRNYLRDGVFYVKDEANLPFIVSQFRDKLNRPESVDFITALQGFTGSGGHPLEVLRQFREMEVLPKEWSDDKDFDGRAILIVDDVKDIPERWKLLLGGKPDFVKAFLLFSEQYEKRKDDPKYFGKKGLDPKLLPGIVSRAHQAGLYVSVHISTAADFHNALVAGADEIAHLPFVDFDKELGNEHSIIAESDAQLAAKRGVRVITTLGWLTDLKAENPQQAEDAVKQVVIPNLKLLKRYQVKLLIGSDQFRQTSLPEILLISSLNVFTNLELLKMACEITPRSILPSRKIGFLRDGYEASFLVLERNPLLDVNNLKSIKQRVKQGVLLE